MTTKRTTLLKKEIKAIEKERNAVIEEAIKLKVDNRKALQDLEDKGWNRVIVSDLPTDPEPTVIEELISEPLPPKKKVKAKPKVDPKEAEIKKLKAQLAKAKAEKEALETPPEPEVIEEDPEVEGE